MKRGGTSRYLVKYIMKSGEKALYSRETPAEICKELSENEEVGTYFDYVTKYVLWEEEKAPLITVEIRRCAVATCGHLRLSKLP